MKRHQLFMLCCMLVITIQTQAQSKNMDANILVGTWVLDMSPENPNDANFAEMMITKVANNTLEGFFYREGVSIRNGKINTQLGTVYGALVSGDNSGDYNTAFYYKDGKLYGSTHALERDFLAVWTATKKSN
ncbi:hypothetical protein C8N46_10935 [Kordia periserrulae]|uniref:Lipocalin-like protein n=1 Tax=Kordia periserrulae TaxID=701523 RepID=A0A2T6BTY7_9FLAO|nr:hypothetical protein [Kordia periserrulae]PTX59447.1 hypothetical protein C8N46_10935 [Kordia periserrulae]